MKITLNGTEYEGPFKFQMPERDRFMVFDSEGHPLTGEDIETFLNSLVPTTEGEYGEPWSVDVQGCELLLLSSSGICQEVCTEIVNQYGTDTLEVGRFKRIAACVNACSGMANPAKEIAKLREIAEAAKEADAQDLSTLRLSNALTAYKEASHAKTEKE